MELYKKHRPQKPQDLVGQDSLVKTLKMYFKEDRFPHTTLLTGPSGCGKTTIARMAAKRLGCTQAQNFSEINCADFRGIDMVREIRQRMNYAATGERSRVWVVDECHQLTKPAQDAFLKILEDTPSHVYFFLCTTEPAKLLNTIKTRSTELAVKRLTPTQAKKLLDNVCKLEQSSIAEEVEERIIELADGSPRKLLVLLDQVISMATVSDALETLENSETERQSIELSRMLMASKINWPKVAALIKGLQDEPESIRWQVLGYVGNTMLGNIKLAPRCAIIIDAFAGNFYDTKRAGLIAACYEVYEATRG